MKVPNYYQDQKSQLAERLYQILLAKLAATENWKAVIAACREIRRHATRARQPRSAAFSLYFEIDAFCCLHDFGSAWRKLRELEQLTFGKNLNLKANRFRSDEIEWFLNFHPQLLYLLGDYSLAKRLFEIALARCIKNLQTTVTLFPHIFNPFPDPSLRQLVTLSHIYEKIGLGLEEWADWRSFVNGLPQKTLRSAGVRKNELRDNPALLRRIYDHLNTGEMP